MSTPIRTVAQTLLVAGVAGAVSIVVPAAASPVPVDPPPEPAAVVEPAASPADPGPDAPAAKEPVVEAPPVDEPVPDEPVADEPATDDPAAKVPDPDDSKLVDIGDPLVCTAYEPGYDVDPGFNGIDDLPSGAEEPGDVTLQG